MPKKAGAKKIMACLSCDFKTTDVKEVKLKESSAQQEEKLFDVVKEELNVHPLVDAECPKCRHDKAYFWEIQTRAGDEAATRFFKCEKCRYVWREYK